MTSGRISMPLVCANARRQPDNVCERPASTPIDLVGRRHRNFVTTHAEIWLDDERQT